MDAYAADNLSSKSRDVAMQIYCSSNVQVNCGFQATLDWIQRYWVMLFTVFQDEG